MNRLSPIGRSNNDSPRSVPTVAAPVSPAGAAATPADTHYAAVRDELLAEGFGLGTRCIVCRRNQAGCLCDYPEPEAEYFRPAVNYDPDAGWALAERSAFGMSASVSGEGVSND